MSIIGRTVFLIGLRARCIVHAGAWGFFGRLKNARPVLSEMLLYGVVRPVYSPQIFFGKLSEPGFVSVLVGVKFLN
jgi:hypothetical protein